MAVGLDAPIVMTEDRGGHLDAAQVAAFVDRTAEPDARRHIELHLATCAECRAEVADTTAIVARSRRRGIGPIWVAGVAAAAVLVMIVWPPDVSRPGSLHRETPVTTTIAPTAVGPVGIVDSAPALLWTAVPFADQYRVRVFTTDGTVAWERETSDTTLAIPPSAGLHAGSSYYWNVEAQTGFDRSVASELIEFSIRLPHNR